MAGTIRVEYSVGTTSFGSFPGGLANSKGFSAWMVERSMIKNRLAKKRSGARISRTKQPVPKNCISKGGSAGPCGFRHDEDYFTSSVKRSIDRIHFTTSTNSSR